MSEKTSKAGKVAQAAWRVGDKAVTLSKKVTGKISVKGMGRIVGKGTFKAIKPFVSMYDGFKDGFKSGQ